MAPQSGQVMLSSLCSVSARVSEFTGCSAIVVLLEIPTTKSQTPNKSQSPIFKVCREAALFGFGL
jgi:hypothetical protein